MSAINKTQRSPFSIMTGSMKIIATLVIACTIAVAGCLASAVSDTDSAAYAAVYAVNDAQGSGDAADKSAGAENGAAATADEATEAEGETIADDENPMSSGLDDAMAVSNTGIPLYGYIIIGIVAVAVFFLVSTRKLESNISKMNKSIR